MQSQLPSRFPGSSSLKSLGSVYVFAWETICCFASYAAGGEACFVVVVLCHHPPDRVVCAPPRDDLAKNQFVGLVMGDQV